MSFSDLTTHLTANLPPCSRPKGDPKPVPIASKVICTHKDNTNHGASHHKENKEKLTPQGWWEHPKSTVKHCKVCNCEKGQKGSIKPFKIKRINGMKLTKIQRPQQNIHQSLDGSTSPTGQ